MVLLQAKVDLTLEGDKGPYPLAMCRSARRAFGEISLVLLSSLLSFAVGSLCIALVALYRQEEAVLIIIACSTILHGISSFPLTILLKNTQALVLSFEFFCILFQLITLGASIEYFNHTTKNVITTETLLHKDLLIGLDSLLLCSFLVGGLALGRANTVIGYSKESKDLESYEPKAYVDNIHDRIERCVPVKNSAQTLTPEMDAIRNLQRMPSWNVGQTSAAHVGESASMSSVIQHRLESMNLSRPATPENKMTSKRPSLKSVITSPKLRKPFVFKFNSPRALTKRTGLGLRKRGKPSKLEMGNGSRTVTSHQKGRLSTIPDLSRSVLNSGGASQDFGSRLRCDKSADSVIDALNYRTPSRPASSIPAIELERNAVGRINSALLPPCLKISDPPTSSSTPSILDLPSRNAFPITPDISADNSIERNGLEDIPQVPQLPAETVSNFFTEQDVPNMDVPQNVTLEAWEKDKETFMKRAANMQENRDNTSRNLLPALKFENEKTVPISEVPDLQARDNFSFPLQKPLELQTKFEDNNYDTISALEEYFRDVGEDEKRESVHIQNGFQYHSKSPSVQAQRFSKEFNRNSFRHSPTKSIISMISGRESLGGHQRSQTILLNNNVNNSNSDGSPSKHSPTRSQRLKRMGKKLSLSNISDTMINITANTDSNSEYKSPFKQAHIRGRSIDFSYIHSLQSNHSPTKSTSGLSSHHGSINKNRRHSLATEKTIIMGGSNTQAANAAINTAVNLNSNNNQNTNTNTKVVDAIQEKRTPPQNRLPSTESSQTSAASTTNYPDIVMSEYDRERWNTLLSLQIVNSKGQFKTH